MSAECQFIQEFDNLKMLQYVNNETSVLHCHHYATLFTKLAFDLDNLNGTVLLREAMEESSFLVLQKYMISNNITDPEDKIAIATQYFGLIGLGQLELTCFGRKGGNAVMSHSHLDEGWLKKWNRHNQPVNFIGQGYLQGAFSVIYNEPIGSYEVEETRSIVMGHKQSEFTLNLKGE